MNDNPKPELLKVVRITDCIPGHADKPGEGEKIAIIHSTFAGKPDHPLMIRMEDVKKLAIHLVRVLVFHDLQIPVALLEEIAEQARDKGWMEEKKSSTKCPRVTPSIHPNNPNVPMCPAEIARLMGMLRRVSDDGILLKRLGVPPEQIATRKRYKKYPRKPEW